jgi:cyclopropane-fatty-acyl-phospholipid synthase
VQLSFSDLNKHLVCTLAGVRASVAATWAALDPARFDERFRRVWRTYLVSCAEMFRSRNGRTHLFQVTVSKGNVAGRYPMDRSFLYRDA